MAMRPEGEAVRAHDVLVGIALGDVPAERIGLSDEEQEQVEVAASVLCWLLRHDHNDTFQKFMEAVERRCLAAGYCVVDSRMPTPGAPT